MTFLIFTFEMLNALQFCVLGTRWNTQKYFFDKTLLINNYILNQVVTSESESFKLVSEEIANCGGYTICANF